MGGRSRLGIAIALAMVVGTAVAPRLLAQGFGTGDQALHIGAAEFVPRDSTVPYGVADSDGYLRPIGTASRVWVAPFHLPAGSEIYQFCLYAYDANPSTVLNAQLVARRMAYAGQSGAYEGIGPAFSTDFDFGYGALCSDPFSYIVRDTGDIDGDALPDHLVYQVRVAIGSGVDGSNLGLGGVRILWRRRISDPPAAASFNDVPTGHPFFQFVEALAASGITAGCGSGNYCPDAPVTRGQMAAFLSKALGLYWPY